MHRPHDRRPRHPIPAALEAGPPSQPRRVWRFADPCVPHITATEPVVRRERLQGTPSRRRFLARRLRKPGPQPSLPNDVGDEHHCDDKKGADDLAVAHLTLAWRRVEDDRVEDRDQDHGNRRGATGRVSSCPCPSRPYRPGRSLDSRRHTISALPGGSLRARVPQLTAHVPAA